MSYPRIGDPITFASGRQFWLRDPRVEDVNLDDIALALSKICRWGGRSEKFYSVAQHCVWVARRVARTHPHLVMQALLHDAAEAYVGDQPRPLKSMLSLRLRTGFEAFSALENRVHAVILRALGVRPSNSNEWGVIVTADEEALATEARDLLRGQKIGTEAPVGDRLKAWPPDRAHSEFLSVYRAHARLADLQAPSAPQPPRPPQHPATQPLAPGQYRGRRGTILDDRSSD